MRFKINSLLPAIIVITIGLAACKKVETIIKNIQTPTSSFVTLVVDPLSKWKSSATTNYIDSTFYFQNKSDSAADITYKWNFGDGTSSQERMPSHVYKKRGQYLVTLVTTRSEIASDTASAIVSVVVGQQEVAIGAAPTSTSAIDILETKEKNFLMLGVSYNSKVYPYNYSCLLMTMDSLLKQKNLVTFPANVQLNGIAACNDGNYIATGTTSGATANSELVKLKTDGTILWSKKVSTDNFVRVAQTADNGFVLTGSRSVKDQNNNTSSKTLLVKTDESGNVLWEKVFATDLVLEQTFNTVVESDGFVIAGTKRRDSNGTYCSYCDSVCVVKLNTQGAIVWKTSVAWALNTDNGGTVRISKMKNGNYNVIGSGLSGLFLFSPAGEFLDRKLMSNATGFYNVSTSGGGIAVLQTENGNGFRARVNGFNEKGLAQWSVGINGQQAVPNGVMCCANSWPVVVSPLSSGGIIFLANKVDLNDYHYTIVMVMADESGQIM